MGARGISRRSIEPAGYAFTRPPRPRAALDALERLVGFDSDLARVRQDLSIAESQLRDYQARLGKPFLHDAYLSELTTLRDQLKAGLSATAQAQGDEARQAVSELAERIKALKSANTIEATPQRARQKHSSAEEPVTARIRRRKKANTVAGEAVEQDATSGPGEMVSPAPAENSPGKPPLTFQERIEMERQSKDQGPTLP